VGCRRKPWPGLFISEETMAQRSASCEKSGRGIPYETPTSSVLDQRIDGVLAVVYGAFTEGYAATAGTQS
jgi:predicted RNA polymerase sigma factor